MTDKHDTMTKLQNDKTIKTYRYKNITYIQKCKHNTNIQNILNKYKHKKQYIHKKTNTQNANMNKHIQQYKQIQTNTAIQQYKNTNTQNTTNT